MLFRHTTDTIAFKADEVIFRQGQPGAQLYIVQQGTVEIRQDQRLLAVSGPGDLVGEMALIDQRPRSATAIARTACVLVPIDAKRFAYLVQQHPTFAFQVMQVLVARLRRMRSLLSPDATRGS